MIDERFYQVKEASAGELADAAGLPIDDENSKIAAKSLSRADRAGSADLTFIEKKEQLLSTLGEPFKAAICFAPIGASEGFSGATLIIETEHPRAAFTKAAPLIAAPRWDWKQEDFVHPTAYLEEGVTIGPNVVIGPEVKIGKDTVLEPGVVVSGGVTIGRNCRIGANTTIKHALLGDNVTILSGSVVGETGFGLAESKEGLLDTPHFGRVIIQDNVSIGACVAIDRGLFDDTVVGQGVKIDNLCQIAHNVFVGPHSVMAAFGGVSGSVNIGKGVMMGGRAGVADHVKIGDGARLAAGSGTMRDVPPGETWMGLPAKPIKTFFREVVWLTRAASGKSKK